MKKNRMVRQASFETNSSSTHCLVLNSKLNGNLLNIEKVLNINLQYYGWENDILSTVNDKLNYIFSALISYDKNRLEEFIEVLFSNGVERINVTHEYEVFNNNQKEHFYQEKKFTVEPDNIYKFIEEIIPSEDSFYDYFIDHQSHYILSELSANEIYDLVRYDDCLIVTSNDNGGTDDITLPEHIFDKMESNYSKEELEELKTRYKSNNKKYYSNNHRHHTLFNNGGYVFNDKTGKEEYIESPYCLYGGIIKY